MEESNIMRGLVLLMMVGVVMGQYADPTLPNLPPDPPPVSNAPLQYSFPPPPSFDPSLRTPPPPSCDSSLLTRPLPSVDPPACDNSPPSSNPPAFDNSPPPPPPDPQYPISPPFEYPSPPRIDFCWIECKRTCNGDPPYEQRCVRGCYISVCRKGLGAKIYYDKCTSACMKSIPPSSKSAAGYEKRQREVMKCRRKCYLKMVAFPSN